MAKKEWVPCHQHMCSSRDKESVHNHFAFCKKHYNATDADVRMTNEAEAWKYEAPIAYRYTLVMHTYVGWQVGKLMGGCFASDPRYEQD